MRIKIKRCLLPEILEKRKMTQEQLAHKTGIRFNQISEYCHLKRTMTIKNAKLIADVLNVKIEDLYEWEYC